MAITLLSKIISRLAMGESDNCEFSWSCSSLPSVLSCPAKDYSAKFLLSSSCSELTKTKPCLLGIDEAGRGPVLGPMVYGIAYAPLDSHQLLKDLGFADSKSLSEEKREDIYNNMNNDESKENIGWIVDVIPPNYISNKMLQRTKESLNEISMNSAIGLIKKVESYGVNIAKIYVDTVGPPEKYEAKLSELFPAYKIKVAKKADSTYPIVSAASIVAKVTRDHVLKAWKFKENIDLGENGFGSGYPADPATKKFLKNHIDQVFGFTQLIRFSWATSETALKDTALHLRWEDEDEDSTGKKNPPKGTKRISTFFAPAAEEKKEKKKPRHQFFTQRHLHLAENFL